MLEIPIKLMMSPVHAFNDPIIGECLKKNQDILKGFIIKLYIYIIIKLI
jgi:hypothetical protein